MSGLWSDPQAGFEAGCSLLGGDAAVPPTSQAGLGEVETRQEATGVAEHSTGISLSERAIKTLLGRKKAKCLIF